MATPKLALHANDVIFQYKAGTSAAEIGRRYGVTTTTVTALLKSVGVMPALPRGVKDERIGADAERAVSLFQSGVRPSEILGAIPRSKSWLYGVLRSAGCDLRGLDGWTPTDDQVCRKASAIEQAGRLNPTEQLVADLLAKAGFKVTPQMAVGRYNIDLAIHSHSVAIEVNCRGTFPMYARTGLFADKIKELANRGWHTYVLVAQDFAAIEQHGIDDMIAWVDFSQRQKAVRRQYRMVRCPFDLLAAGCSDSDDLAGILRPENLFYGT